MTTQEWSVSGNLVQDNTVRTVRTVRTGKSAESAENSSVGAGSTVKGILSFMGPVSVDGVIEGDLLCSSEVSVGEGGKVKANIRAEVVKVFGTVLGDIAAESLVELFAGAKVVGNIKAARVAIHDGVNFQGQCKMIEAKKTEEAKDLATKNIVKLDSVLPKEGL